MEYEHEEVCNFKKYAKQTLDLMVDAYKWKIMAKYCDNHEMRTKYRHVSDTLMELFMEEHNAIGEMFKED
jgi:hypothetical protein